MMEALWTRDAVAMAAAIATRETTSEAVVRSCLERIGERESDVQAWEFLDPDLALAEARVRDREAPSGMLHGVPVAIKDIIDTADMPTAYGSAIYQGHRPVRDAACVARLRAAGAVILGKTVTTEFATFKPGKTRNPHHPGHTPGGSSSGSAAAVAAGMAPLALGSQTVGSVIRPAAFCGVIGFKTSQGHLDLEGVKALAVRLDSLGCFARSVRDVALWLSVLSGEPAAPPREAPPRVALIRTAHWDEAAAESRSAVEVAAAALARAGCSVAEPRLSPLFDELTRCQDMIFARGAREALDLEWRTHRDALSPQLLEVLERGDAIGDEAVAAALATVATCGAMLERAFRDFDVILTPATLDEAPEGLATTGNPLFNRAWTVLLGPCATLPTAKGTHRLPIGIQLVGPRGGDGAFVADLSWIASALGFSGGVAPV